MSLEAQIPNVAWPERNGLYKVAQFIIDGQPYLRFGQEYHRHIVQSFAQEIGLEPILDFKRYIFFLPDEERYKIAGMGRCQLNLTERVAEFFGVSSDYEIGISEEHLELIKPFCPDMNITYNPSRFR